MFQSFPSQMIAGIPVTTTLLFAKLLKEARNGAKTSSPHVQFLRKTPIFLYICKNCLKKAAAGDEVITSLHEVRIS